MSFFWRQWRLPLALLSPSIAVVAARILFPHSHLLTAPVFLVAFGLTGAGTLVVAGMEMRRNQAAPGFTSNTLTPPAGLPPPEASLTGWLTIPTPIGPQSGRRVQRGHLTLADGRLQIVLQIVILGLPLWTSERLNVAPGEVIDVFPAVSQGGFAGVGVLPHDGRPYYLWCRVAERETVLAALQAGGFPVTWRERREFS
jgi:hypothetical protein